VLSRPAEAVEPGARHPVQALGQPVRRQHGHAVRGPHGVIVVQAADQLDEQSRVPGRLGRQRQQARVRGSAERVGQQRRRLVAGERRQPQPDGAVILKHVEQPLRVRLPGPGPGQQPRHRAVAQRQ
jgi:hypothetical protein